MAAEPIETQSEQRTEVHDAGQRGSLLAQGNLGIDLMSDLKGRYVEDTFFQAVLDKPKDFRNFEHHEQFTSKKMTREYSVSQK